METFKTSEERLQYSILGKISPVRGKVVAPLEDVSSLCDSQEQTPKQQWDDWVESFLFDMEGHNTEEKTLPIKRRHLKNQLGPVVIDLWEQGRISSYDPAEISKEDIRVISGIRKKSVSTEIVFRDMTVLKQLCGRHDNFCVDAFKIKYPHLWPKRIRRMKKHLTNKQIDAILARALDVIYNDHQNFRLIRAYMVVILATFGGVRPGEQRFILCDNVHYDEEENTINIQLDYVKGIRTYGEPRLAPIIDDPRAYDFILKYVERWGAMTSVIGTSSAALIFPLFSKHDGDFLCYNTINEDKTKVERDIGFKFNLTIGRATFADQLIKDKVPNQDVSLAMGHKDFNTVPKHYAVKSQIDAVGDIHAHYKENPRRGGVL